MSVILGWVGHDTERQGKFQPREEGLADREVCIAVTAIKDDILCYKAHIWP